MHPESHHNQTNPPCANAKRRLTPDPLTTYNGNPTTGRAKLSYRTNPNQHNGAPGPSFTQAVDFNPRHLTINQLARVQLRKTRRHSKVAFRESREMNDPDGIINLFKPTGITSAKALYRVRRITSIRKSGHAGTLDPAADGVLLICQGKATKLVERLMTLPKVYRATARLDVTSESFDSDRPLIPVRINQMPDDNKVRGAFSGFEGKIEQTPPRISAIKLNGVPAYRTAGQADAPPISPRTVHIHWIQLRRYDWPTVYFDVACGRGTYIRALIRDIGTQLATGGCLTGLQRTAVGPFNVDNAWSFDRLPSAAMHEYLIPLDRVSKILNEESNVIPQRPQTCQFI